jgi:hypothetical protein
VTKPLLRFLPAAVLLGVAASAALLAADVQSWQRTLQSADALSAVAPQETSRTPATALPAGLVERLLGVRDDLAARRAIGLFRKSASRLAPLGGAVRAAADRSRAEDALEAVGRRGRGARAAQADTLLGLLAFGDLVRDGGEDPAEAQATVSDFQNAVRADPGNETATWDLELVLRLLTARGVSPTAPQTETVPGSTGRRGAGSTPPGGGY